MADPRDQPRVAVVGDLMIDVSVRAGQLAAGGDVHGEVLVRPGGGGANAAVWAASRGVHVELYGRIGEDLGGDVLAASVRERGVDIRVARDGSTRTGALLSVHDENERSMVADRGANARVRPEDLPSELRADSVLVSGYLLFHPSSEPAARAALERARATHVAVDAASWPLIEEYGVEEFFAATDGATLILANEREAETLTGASAGDAARELARRYATACVKLGEGGAIFAKGDDAIRADTEPAEPADPTGAGDAFAGVLLAELAKHGEGARALTAAVDAATSSVASAAAWPEP